MSFKHLTEVKNNEEQPIDEKTKTWSGAMENYTLKKVDNTFELIVEMDMAENHEKYFSATFPKALEKVNELSEK